MDTALRLYWGPNRGDNFTTATAQGVQDALAAGYIFIRIEGYTFASSQPNTVPLKLYWNPFRGDNFVTATAQGEQDALAVGYGLVRVEGYVSSSPTNLEIDLTSDLGANHWMTTRGVMLANGHIDAQTRTRTGTWFGGFTGGVQILFEDANGFAIGGTQIHSFGVDGTWIGRSDRTDYWFEDIDPTVARRTTAIHVLHFWYPRYGAIQNIVTRAVAAARPMVDLINEIKAQGDDAK